MSEDRYSLSYLRVSFQSISNRSSVKKANTCLHLEEGEGSGEEPAFLPAGLVSAYLEHILGQESRHPIVT